MCEAPSISNDIILSRFKFPYRNFELRIQRYKHYIVLLLHLANNSKGDTTTKKRKLEISGRNGGVGKVKSSRALGLSRRLASLRPTRARLSHGRFRTISVLSKLFTMYVSLNPSRVSRETSRDLWRSIWPSTIVVSKQRTSVSARPLCSNIE